jgi:hypothetical protein
MKCELCKDDFMEKEIHESHDVPCYLFYKEIGRNAKKNRADKFGRHYLCIKCHETYEKALNETLINSALKFSQLFFSEKNKEDENGNTEKTATKGD